MKFSAQGTENINPRQRLQLKTHLQTHSKFLD